MGQCRYCDEQARRGDLCATHDKRRVRHASMSAPVRHRHGSPRARLREGALAYADASDTDETDFQRADDRLAKAALHYALSLPEFRGMAARRPVRPRRMRGPTGAVIQLELWQRA